MKLFDLADHSIGLTGGGGHIGRATALALVDAGATVAIAGRRLEALEEVHQTALGLGLRGRMVVCQADVSDCMQVERVLDRLEQVAGRVDGWVNNACSATPGSLLEASREQVEATVRGGFIDPFLVTQAVARRMLPQRSGSIVNIASMYGMVSPQPEAYRTAPEFHNPPAYGAAKAALLQFTRYAACHLAGHGIRVNAVSPGPIPSPVVQQHGSFMTELSNRAPLGRIGQPEEVVGAVMYLLSAASSYVTGTNLVVDGGWTAW